MRSVYKFIAEFVGTFAIVFAGCGSVAIMERFPEVAAGPPVPMVFGLIVASMIYATGHISGAHFNPAVTLAFAVARKFPKSDIPVYWMAQFLAGIVACGLLYAILPEGSAFGATVPKISLLSAFALEVIITFFLMFVIIAVATDTRAVGIMAGAAIGGTVMFNAMFAGPITGASMNPARSFGPNLFEGQLEVYWVYLFAPCLGAVLAALTYEMIRCVESSEEGSSGGDAGGCC